MSPEDPSHFPDDDPGLPERFLPEEPAAGAVPGSGEDLVVEQLPDEANLPGLLLFRQESPPRWADVPVEEDLAGTEEVDGLPADDFVGDYAAAFGEAKSRLNGLIAGFESEKRQAQQRVEHLAAAAATLRFHLERIEQVQTAGLSRPRLIRELERGLVALDAAERDLDLESGRGGARKGRGAAESRKPAWRGWSLSGIREALLRGVAFSVPLVLFLVVALILVATALGWF